jgi:hypothetical protein
VVEQRCQPYVPEEILMKKFIGWAAVGVVAFFVALPTPAVARSIGRYNV